MLCCHAKMSGMPGSTCYLAHVLLFSVLSPCYSYNNTSTRQIRTRQYPFQILWGLVSVAEDKALLPSKLVTTLSSQKASVSTPLTSLNVV